MDTGMYVAGCLFLCPSQTELGSSSCSRNSSPTLQQALHIEPVIFQSPAPNANHCTTIDSPHSTEDILYMVFASSFDHIVESVNPNMELTLSSGHVAKTEAKHVVDYGVLFFLR